MFKLPFRHRPTPRRINVAVDFSPFPSGAEGPEGGRAFRDEVLLPALEDGPVHIDFTGVLGVASSWIAAAFLPGDDVRVEDCVASTASRVYAVTKRKA